MVNFANIDLNLLRVFDALFEERSVTRAGSRLHVTQSAVSHALARLRDILDDELFIKSPDGMTPTAKARAVGPRLRAGLLQLQAALVVDEFTPATAEHHYTIAADAYACAVLLPGVVGRIRAEAPGVDVRITPGVADIAEALDTGRVDLAISAYGRVPERLGLRELLRERLVWVLRADHPLAQEPLTLERLASLPHVVRALTDERTEAMDGMIVEHGLGTPGRAGRRQRAGRCAGWHRAAAPGAADLAEHPCRAGDRRRNRPDGPGAVAHGHRMGGPLPAEVDGAALPRPGNPALDAVASRAWQRPGAEMAAGDHRRGREPCLRLAARKPFTLL